MAADLLEQDETIERGGRELWMDSGLRILLDEVTALIADRLGREGAPEWEILAALDGVPTSVVLLAADRLDVTVSRGMWRRRRRA